MTKTRRFVVLLFSVAVLSLVSFVVISYHSKAQFFPFVHHLCKRIDRPDAGSATNASCVTGRPCTYLDVVDIRVIVLAFNRAQSLSKLLLSLDSLVLDGDRPALEIWIDRDRKGSVHRRTLEVASAFSWKVGPSRVHVQVFDLLKTSRDILADRQTHVQTDMLITILRFFRTGDGVIRVSVSKVKLNVTQVFDVRNQRSRPALVSGAC